MKLSKTSSYQQLKLGLLLGDEALGVSVPATVLTGASHRLKLRDLSRGGFLGMDGLTFVSLPQAKQAGLWYLVCRNTIKMWHDHMSGSIRQAEFYYSSLGYAG